GREHFALLLKGKNPLQDAAFKLFAHRVRADTIGNREPDFSSIRDQWQELERLAIGVYHRLIQDRLNEEHRRELRECLAEPTGRGVDAFINRRLREPDHYVPMNYIIGAFDALREFVRQRPSDRTRRAPIAIRLRMAPPSGQKAAERLPHPVDVSQLATKLMDGVDIDETFRFLQEAWLGNPEK